MVKHTIEFPQYTDDILEVLKQGRALLMGKTKEGKPNPMTIAWGSIMYAWNKPIFMAMVRKSRYTYELLESNNSFSVNLLSKDYQKALQFCGTKSGRDYDKFEATQLTPVAAKSINVPIIKEAFFNMECKIISKGSMDAASTEQSILQGFYPLKEDSTRDLHILYFGEILHMYGDFSQK